MIKKEFPGAWYADALPEGEYAVLFKPSHIETHQGTLTLPQNNWPLYHRITNVGGFKIAGQAQSGNQTLLWNGEWNFLPQPAVGVSPVIFDNTGTLLVSNGTVGSQGYRYINPDGLAVSGDATYNDITPLAKTLNVHLLAEWTLLDTNLAIGQFADDTDRAVVWDGIHHRLLEAGQCRFIRAARKGDKVSVAIWKPNVGAVVYWMTVAELKALPIVERKPVPVPPPVVVPPPPPPPPAPKPPAPKPPPPPVAQPPSVPKVEGIPVPKLVKGFLPGVCWPVDAPFFLEFDPKHLRELALIGLRLLRVDLHHANMYWRTYLTQIVNAGLIPLPIVRASADQDQQHERALVVAFLEELLKACPWLPAIEVENEPSARFDVDDYINLATVVGQEVKRVNPSTKVIVAAETHDFSSGKAHDYWPKVKKALDPALYDAVAVHPYRNPKPWSFSAFGSREKEWDAIKEAVGEKEIWITETGWKANEDQHINVVNDLDYWRSLGAKSVCIYAFVGHGNDFGLYEDTAPWTPRPAAVQLAHYFEEKPIETA